MGSWLQLLGVSLGFLGPGPEKGLGAPILGGLERSSEEDRRQRSSRAWRGRAGGYHTLAERGPAVPSSAPTSPRHLGGCPSWLHNSPCGPLLPVPAPALEGVQSQMERSWGLADRRACGPKDGSLLRSMGSGERGGGTRKKLGPHLLPVPFCP